jgi:hypothetical protein
MPTSRARRTRSIGTKSAELAVAVPQVMAHRLARMSIAGARPSNRDQKEFQRMVAEKKNAFAESWVAMATQTVLAQQALAMSLARSLWAPTLLRKPSSAAALARQVQSEALGVLDKGLTPVHRKAVANAKRLARTKLR